VHDVLYLLSEDLSFSGQLSLFASALPYSTRNGSSKFEPITLTGCCGAKSYRAFQGGDHGELTPKACLLVKLQVRARSG
jgi:hypothetical protein